MIDSDSLLSLIAELYRALQAKDAEINALRAELADVSTNAQSPT